MIQMRPSVAVSAVVNSIRQFYDAGSGVTQTTMLGASGSVPALYEDFTTGQTLDPRITFTRASTATRFNSSGVLVSEAINDPRFDYDPVTLAPKGLLIEEQRTNSIRNNTMVGAVAGTPGTLPTNWTVTAAAGVAVAVAGIGTESGINYVDLFVSGTASASGQIFVSPESITSTVAATGQSWAAAWYLSLVSGSITSTGLSSQRVDLTGRDAAGVTLETSQQTYVPVTGSLAAQRPQITRTLANAGSVRVHSAFRVDVASGAAVSFTLRIGLPQLEQGAFATSVIPTTTAAATRAADVAVMTGTNFSSWYNQTEGTLFAEFNHFYSSSATFPRIVSADDGTSNNAVRLGVSGVTAYSCNTVVGGVTQAGLVAGSVANNAVIKSAGAYKLNDFCMAANGNLGTPDTSGTIPTVSQLSIGSVAGVNWLNGHIRRIAYYPRRLSNAELQSITS